MPSPGSVFAGRFVVDAEIGSGGFGVVYRARHQRTAQPCALKVLTADALFDDEARRRFLDEARRTPSNHSEHVVRVYDADVTDGVPWISMELLEGATLAAHITAQGPLSPRDFERFFAELCDGVGAAHARGIVHRDLKPENVFLHRRGGVGLWSVKVLDFGVAKQLDGSPRGANASVAVRTNGWGAPEQTVLGRIDPAADVWSLGLLAYFARTGKGYFGDRALGETVVPASVRAQGQGVAERLPKGFDAWFARCVAWDPATRFHDAGETFAAWCALRETPVAKPPRHARYAVGLLVAVLGLLAAGWWLGTHRDPAPAPTSLQAEADPQPPHIEAPQPVQQVVRDWIRSMEARRMDADTVTRLYAPLVRLNGQRLLATPNDLLRYWQRQMTSRDWSFRRTAGSPIVVHSTPAPRPADARSVCNDATTQEVSLEMIQHEPERGVRTDGAVPCADLRGSYRLYIHQAGREWRICHESFAPGAICGACPDARGCSQRP